MTIPRDTPYDHFLWKNEGLQIFELTSRVVDSSHIFGLGSDTAFRHCELGLERPSLLVTNDVGE